MQKYLLAAIIAGIVLSLYALLLKLFPIPCFTEGCSYVIHSQWGEIAGIPVSAVSLLLWFSFAVKNSTVRHTSVLLLVVGSIYFLGVQRFVLQQFCEVCVLHALVSLSLVFVLKPTRTGSGRWVTALEVLCERDRPRQPGAFSFPPIAGVVGVVCGLLLYGINDIWAIHSLQQAGVVQKDLPPPAREDGAPVGADVPMFELLSPRSTLPGYLVLSINCPACLRLLDNLLMHPVDEKESYPVIFTTSGDTLEATAVLLAAAKAASEAHISDGFPFAYAVAASHTQLLYNGDAAALRELLQPVAPDLDAHVEIMRETLLQQERLVAQENITGTPVLITPDGPQARLNARHLFR